MEKILERVRKQLENGNEDAVVTLLDKMESKLELTPELQEKLDNVKNTPILEPKIYKAIGKKETDGYFKIVKSLITEEEIKNYSPEELGDFIRAVEEKVTFLKDEDNFYKRTENTKTCKLPSAPECDELWSSIMENEGNRHNARKKGSTSENLDTFIKSNEELDKKILSIAGLENVELTDWEKVLVIDMTYATVQGYRNHAQGKRFKN